MTKIKWNYSHEMSHREAIKEMNEGEGFVFHDLYDDEYPEYHKKIARETVRVCVWDNNVITIDRSADRIFCGTIKNITEFRKLLKQLGV